MLGWTGSFSLSFRDVRKLIIKWWIVWLFVIQRVDTRPEAPSLDDFADAVTMEDKSATAVDFNQFFGLLPQPVVVSVCVISVCGHVEA